MKDHTNPIVYDRYGRMAYNPEFHARHKMPWTTEEQKYLIENYAKDGPEAIALALERTIGTIMTRARFLRRKRLMPLHANKVVYHPRAYRPGA